MSNKYINWAWSITVKPGLKLALICLADMADDNGECFPKQSTIAKKTGLSRETINRHIKKLEQLGYLKNKSQRYKDGRKRSSIYQLITDTDFLQSDISSHGKLSPFKVPNYHNRIPQRDPLLIGGIH